MNIPKILELIDLETAERMQSRRDGDRAAVQFTILMEVGLEVGKTMNAFREGQREAVSNGRLAP